MPIAHKEDALSTCNIGSEVHMAEHIVIHIMALAVLYGVVDKWLQYLRTLCHAVRLARLSAPPLTIFAANTAYCPARTFSLKISMV